MASWPKEPATDVLTAAPTTYLRRFHVDTNVWSTAALRLLKEVLGVDRLLVGNDQPPVWFPLGESMARLAALDLTLAEREAVHWGLGGERGGEEGDRDHLQEGASLDHSIT